MYKELINKENKLALVGLGYVGLPIALEFAKHISVIGFDINSERVEKMKNNIDPSDELTEKDFKGTDIEFTASAEDLKAAQFYIVAVPTPVDEHKVPDLNPVKKASETVGKVLKKGDYVVYESTVFPGCTEEDCIPILEKTSGLKFRDDFKVGYSPERINPGDKVNTLADIVKLVSGCDDESLDEIAKIYEIVIKAGVHRTSSMKVAEATKIIENTQRDVNIALMNELSMILDKMDINTYEVLEAGATKWNFLKFYPGLVGGHCIGVDPYYLTYKANELGVPSNVILSGRRINDEMGRYIARKTVQFITKKDKDVTKSKVLMMGVTFKENVSDIRNSKIADIYDELNNYSVVVDVMDPHADTDELEKEYGFGLITAPKGPYDAIIVGVNHDKYLKHDEAFFKSISSDDGIIVDVKGIFRDKIKDLKYWSL